MTFVLDSTCESNAFICNDGGCIDLEDRCNGRFECQDRSDEINCPGKTKINALFIGALFIGSDNFFLDVIKLDLTNYFT